MSIVLWRRLVANRLPQFGQRELVAPPRQLHVAHGSDQILGGHLVDALRREQRETRSLSLLKHLAELCGRADANPPQVGFGQSFLTR